LNGATFNVMTPASAVGNDLTFYFGFLQVNAGWSLTSTSAFGSISGSFAEVIASFYSIIVYEDRDNNTGFQYKLGKDVLDCSLGTDYDCVRTDAGLYIDLKTLTWDPISHTTINCTADLVDPVAGEQCSVTVWTMKTHDSMVIFDLKTTTHPLTLGDRYLDPDTTKIDVSINFDWTGKTCDNCKLGLTAATAGKLITGSLSFNASADDGSTTANFEASGGFSAFVAWDSSAAIKGVTSTVYYTAVKYADLDAWQCQLLSTTNNCLAPTSILNIAWKLALGVWSAFGWDGTVLVFSWADVKPTSVFWDPTLGGKDPKRIYIAPPTTSSESTGSASSVFFSYVIFQLMMLMF